MPIGVLEPQIDETGTRHLDGADVGIVLQRIANPDSKFARILANRLGEHHRRIGRDIAMARIARRFDTHARQIHRSTICGFQIKRLQGVLNPRVEIGEDVHDVILIRVL